MKFLIKFMRTTSSIIRFISVLLIPATFIILIAQFDLKRFLFLAGTLFTALFMITIPIMPFLWWSKRLFPEDILKPTTLIKSICFAGYSILTYLIISIVSIVHMNYLFNHLEIHSFVNSMIVYCGITGGYYLLGILVYLINPHRRTIDVMMMLVWSIGVGSTVLLWSSGTTSIVDLEIHFLLLMLNGWIVNVIFTVYFHKLGYAQEEINFINERFAKKIASNNN